MTKTTRTRTEGDTVAAVSIKIGPEHAPGTWDREMYYAANHLRTMVTDRGYEFDQTRVVAHEEHKEDRTSQLTLTTYLPAK